MKKFLFVFFTWLVFSLSAKDTESQRIYITNEKVKNNKDKRAPILNDMSIHLPDESFASELCRWLTSEYSLKFNSTSTVTEETLANALPIIANRMSSQKDPYIYMWFVKKDGNLVGEFSVDEINYYNNKAILRYVVNDNMYGQGIGTKIMYLMLWYAFDILHLHKVYAQVAVKNTASIKIFKKFGFREIGILKEEYLLKNGERADMIYFEILRKEFNTLKENYKNFLLKKNEI